MSSWRSRSSTSAGTSRSPSSSGAPPTKAQRLASGTPLARGSNTYRPFSSADRSLYARGTRLKGAHHLPTFRTSQHAIGACPSPSGRIDDDKTDQTSQPHTTPEPATPSTPSSQKRTEGSYRKKTFFDQQPAHTDQIFFLEKNYNDFFQFSDRDLEMVIPFPPSPLREAHLQKKSEFLSILSPIDKDVSWFYKTLSILGKPGGLYSDLLQSDEILSRFSFLVLDIHTLSSFVVKRLLIRSQNNEAGLEVENGIEQLYKHVYFDVLKGVEQSIMNHLRRHHSQITVRPLKEVFILEEESQCYYAHFKIHHPKAPLPALIGSIPWVLALSLVRTRRVFLKAGIVYFCYMDAPNLAKDAWKIGMDYWRRYEASDLLEQAAKYTYIDVRNAASLPFSFESAHLEEICIQNKKHISPAPPPAASRTLIQLPNTPSGSFLTDYKPIMPPCIAAIVDKHLIEGSHMQYSDRLTFFSWCYRAGAPLESVVDFWSDMLQNDSNVDRHKAKSLVVNLQGIYKSLAQKSSNYGFKSCEAMRKDSRCPIQPTSSSSNIVDIEDLKSECRRMCSAPASFKFWSPMSATKTLSQNKRRK